MSDEGGSNLADSYYEGLPKCLDDGSKLMLTGNIPSLKLFPYPTLREAACSYRHMPPFCPLN